MGNNKKITTPSFWAGVVMVIVAMLLLHSTWWFATAEQAETLARIHYGFTALQMAGMLFYGSVAAIVATAHVFINME